MPKEQSSQSSIRVDPPHVCDTGACCSACFRTDGQLLRCSKCNHAWYCNRDCQLKDFPNHKAFCKAMAVWDKLWAQMPEELWPANAQEFYIQRVRARELLQRVLKREPSRSESRAIVGEAKCSVCFKVRAQLPVGEELRCCPACHWGWVCGAHWDQYHGTGRHSTELCNTYQTMNKAEVLLSRWIEETGKVPTYRPETVFSSYLPLPEKGWTEYTKWRPLPKTDPASFAVFSGRLTQVLTVAAGLERMYSREEMSSLEDVVIHVIGAGGFEIPADSSWEEILHLIPSVRSLEVVFIGPEVGPILAPASHGKSVALETCDTCAHQGRKRTYTNHPVVYHEYVRQRQRQGLSCRPTLAVAFNSGASEEDTELWKPSLTCLVEHDVPTVFTSYATDEAVKEEELWRSLGGQVTHPHEENPYRATMPLPEPAKVDSFYYQNNFWFCGRGRRGKE